MIFTILTYALTFMTGFVLANIAMKISNNAKIKGAVDKCSHQFEEALKNIKSGNSKFMSRINNTVIIDTKTNDLGEINIVYIIDKGMVCIFKNNLCLYTSDIINPMMRENIILNICEKYKNEIDDTVELFGVVISRKELHEKYEELNEKINSGEIDIKGGESNMIEEIIKAGNKISLDIDQILDKINEVGLEKLSEEEKEFLNNYNKN